MGRTKIKRPLAARIARLILKSILFLLLFIIAIFLLTLTPPVQRFLTERTERYLERKLQTRVDIDRISFDPFGNVKLKGVYVENRNQDTLLAGRLVKARVNIFKLFSNRVLVKNLELQDIHAFVERVAVDSNYSFQFIVDAFTPARDSADITAAAPMQADLDNIKLQNVRIDFNDAVSGSAMNLYAGNLNTAFHSTDINQMVYDIPTVQGNDIRAIIKQFKPLANPESLAKDVAEARKIIPLQLMVGSVDLADVDISYGNDVSAVYADLSIGTLQSKQRDMNLQSRTINMDELVFSNSSIRIRMDKKEEAAEVIKEVEQELLAQENAGWNIHAASLRLENDTLVFENNNASPVSYGIDFSHLNATGLTLHGENIVFNQDSIGGTITKASVKEQSGFILEELRGDLLYSSNEAYARNIYIKTPGTEIKRDASIRYASREELVRNFDRTIMTADFDNSYVQVKDILAFAPMLRRNKAFSNPEDVWELDLKGQGTLDRLVIDHLNFDGLYNTQINASGTLTGLSQNNQAGGQFDIDHLHTTQTDISLFTGRKLSTAAISIPEDITISGTLNGNAGALNTNLNISTSSGAMLVNGRFQNLGRPNDLVYDASILTRSLQLGKIINQPQTFGLVTGHFVIKGSGTSLQNADLSFNANVDAMDYNRYRYQNIVAKGNVSNGNYDIDAAIKDPNADAHLFVKGDFNGNTIAINGMIDSIKTQPLNLTPGPLIARGKIDGAIYNLKGDNVSADIVITKGLFVSNQHRLPLDTIRVMSGRNDSANFITVRSDITNADISGQYRLADLGNIIQNSIQPYLPALQTNRAVAVVRPYSFNFNISATYSPILTSFIPQLSSFEDLVIRGSAASGAGINADLTASSLVFNGNEISQLSLRAFPSANGLQVNATASRIKKGTSLNLYNVSLDGLASGNNVQFTVATDDQAGRDKYRASGVLTVNSSDNYSVSLTPGNLLLNYEQWSIAAGNRINFGKNAITAENFLLQKDNQQLRITNANIRQGSLDVQFTQFRLATITGFMKTDSLSADGLINGNLTITNIMKSPAFTGRVMVNDFSMQKDTIGNVDIQVTAAAGNRHNTTATITGRGNDISLRGYFVPEGNDILTDFDVEVRALQLSTMEGALAKVLSNASGSMAGTIRINGRLSDPKITGEMSFNNASFIPNILGSRFRIGEEKLTLTEEGIAFSDFVVQDSAGNRLVLNGRALTKDFTHYELDLSVNARNFEVLNTKKGPGKIYYGKLNVTANLRILGTELKPRADGNIVVNKGTEFTFIIPQVDEGVAQRDGIVEFVDMDSPENDSLFLAYDSLNQSGILGFDVFTTIEINKEAIFNVVVDEANGDFLNVQGEAQLSAGIDPSGKVTLAGNYVLERGSYQISFNFIRRRFEIQRGSNIIWTGEPTAARLDIEAIYIANTAPLDLVSAQLTADVNRNLYLQRLPFEVHLNLTGELLKPIIDFDILLPERNYGVSNDIVTAVESKLSLIRQDEGEINKQVFSLLLLNRFVGENPFQSETDAFSFNSYARQSVSKLLTEQLNQLAAGLISGVDINFDVVSTDDYTTGSRMNRTDLNIGLSKRLLSNRLKISVGSNFQLEGPQNSNQQSNNIAGNVAVDYQISRDGRYAIRFYRQNEYQGIVDGYIIETGVSFIFSVDYERFMQIFRKKKRPQANAAPNKTGT